MPTPLSISGERFARFAPDRADAERLGLPRGPLTQENLEAARTRLETQRDAFADAGALLEYVKAQLTFVSASPQVATAAPSSDDTVIVDDVVPRRPPTRDVSMLERLGVTPDEIARAEALDLSPQALAFLLTEPDRPSHIRGDEPAPCNTPADVFAAVESGLRLSDLAELHRGFVPVNEMAFALEAAQGPERYVCVRRHVDAPTAVALLKAGFDTQGAMAAARLESPLEDLEKARAQGFDLQNLWRVLDHLSFDDALWLQQRNPKLLSVARLYTYFSGAELKQLCTANLIPKAGDLEATYKSLAEFREAGASFADIAQLQQAGVKSVEFRTVATNGGGVDDAVTLHRAGWNINCPTGLTVWSADEVLRLVQAYDRREQAGSSKVPPVEKFSHICAYGGKGLNVEQAEVLIAAGVSDKELEKHYLSAGMTLDEAVRSIAAGG
ncbi:MAG: hypothetical protein IPJ65_03580 [Archangiaceae bacterium]|nr:hypothetical protein [Archangiaceae bacterium]